VSNAPSLYPVTLQIYNRVSTTWVDLQTNNLADAATDFTLTGTKTGDVSMYYDVNNYISCRVYQALA